ncbi:MAG: hypothetical protein B6U87_03060 [Candidatus Aenigmarchaeota archaeon ex4484_52]|nr:MAG: hypothetical protein B6U87_03060 [Candidatus Aenigmarchaeota archaeon ex4484_52]
MQMLTKSNWTGFNKILKLNPNQIIETVKKSGLKGRSGSCFPTGLKWSLMGKGKRYLICNADEGEPGTFKDKFIIQNNPQLLIEGIAIAAYALDAHKAFIYLKGEYNYLKKNLLNIIEKSKNQLKKIDFKALLQITPKIKCFLFFK